MPDRQQWMGKSFAEELGECIISLVFYGSAIAAGVLLVLWILGHL